MHMYCSVCLGDVGAVLFGWFAARSPVLEIHANMCVKNKTKFDTTEVACLQPCTFLTLDFA